MAAFKMFSLFLTFRCLSRMWLGVISFVFLLLGVCSAAWIFGVIFTNFENSRPLFFQIILPLIPSILNFWDYKPTHFRTFHCTHYPLPFFFFPTLHLHFGLYSSKITLSSLSSIMLFIWHYFFSGRIFNVSNTFKFSDEILHLYNYFLEHFITFILKSMSNNANIWLICGFCYLCPLPLCARKFYSVPDLCKNNYRGSGQSYLPAERF